MRPSTIRDVVDIRPHPAVVRLSESGTALWIRESFVCTPEVEAHLQVIRNLLVRACGCGAFVIGQYGCGKSHLLSYLLQEAGAGGFGEIRAVAISLVNYAASVPLEEIVSQALGLVRTSDDRRRVWGELQERGGRLLILIDELSEFLRSKPTRESFNEDIRFLQFMGEWAQGAPLWIIAAMQEQIEHTGDIEYDLFRKIKDRYPVRLLMTQAHVRELIGRGILVKKRDYGAAVEQFTVELKKRIAVPLAIEDLRAIYPIHPATLLFLEEIRDRFSQARGVVDFVTTRLGGDPARGIKPFLDEPWGALLTPDALVDHYRDLLEVQSEYLPLSQEVFPYYREGLERLFPTESARSLAAALLKLLVLVHLSPTRRGMTAAEAAAWLAFSPSRLDASLSVKVIDSALTKMAADGRYVGRRGDAFALDLRDRGEESLEPLLRREVAELQGHGDSVFEIAAALLEEGGFNPFTLPRDQWQNRTVTWHFHERSLDVFFGNGAVPRHGTGLPLCIRLPWGVAEPAPGVHTIVPKRIEMGEEILELAALDRIKGMSAASRHAAAVRKRLADRLALFQAHVRTAYLEAVLHPDDDADEIRLRFDTAGGLAAWLSRHGEWMLRRRYPAFERMAPVHGPLPKEAYRNLMRFASKRSLCDAEADENTKLIRESYLVPMGLLQRRGRDYIMPQRLDRNELVALLMPIIEHHPAPAVLYDHLAGPVYGLVPDQIHLLLVFLLIQGELDILKEGKSYREVFEMLPWPLQYDRVVPGRGLGVEHVRALEILCHAMQVTVPKQWTVAAQRKAIGALRAAGRVATLRMQPALIRLEQTQLGPELSRKLRRVLDVWAVLDRGEDDLRAFVQMLFDAQGAERFLALVEETADAPERLQRVLGELQRLRHLFGHPALAVATDLPLLKDVARLGEAPSLDRGAELDEWLGDARRIYEEHKAWYREAHEEWWRRPRGAWEWVPPTIATSRFVGVAEELRQLDSHRKRAVSARCRGLVNLDYQPICVCGFDGTTAPAAEEIEAFDRLRAEILERLRLFFGQQQVKRQLETCDPQTASSPAFFAYLQGAAPFPDVDDVRAVDDCLNGGDVVRQLDAVALLQPLTGRTWTRRELVRALEGRLSEIEEDRLQLRLPETTVPDALLEWCAERVLRGGVPLSKGIGAVEARRIAGFIRAEWVGEAAVGRLDELGLDETAEDRVLGWLIDGSVRARDSRSPLVRAALEVIRPTQPADPEALAAAASELYTQHPRMHRVAGPRWLARLDALAGTTLDPGPEPLSDVLQAYDDHRWIVVDGLGLPLLPALLPEIESALTGWSLGCRRFAWTLGPTTTDQFYREMIAAGHVRSFAKIDVVDEILHASCHPLDRLARRVAAELGPALKQVIRSVDRAVPLLVFADHGFRLAPDGHAYTHGGRSALEGIVPVLPFRVT